MTSKADSNLISKDEVLRVAKLARIQMDEAELETVQKKFAAILDSFRFLSEANTDGIEAVYHAAESLELRPDIPEDPIPVEDLLKNAPESSDHCFKIPRVIGVVE